MRLECSVTVRFPIHFVPKFMWPAPKKCGFNSEMHVSEGVSISHRIAQVGFPGGSVSRIRAPQMRFLRWVQVGLKNIAKTDEFLFCFASMVYNAPREGLCRAFALITWIRRFRNPRAVVFFAWWVVFSNLCIAKASVFFVKHRYYSIAAQCV